MGRASGEAEALKDAPPGEERQSPGAPIAGRVSLSSENVTLTVQ